ncbi:MAG: arginine--tRNA ligase, partial [Candidatus Omnitrophica bacterium]|nr:arginine--tRNA ligase [Candidatus Omnitrophota bacterium]
MLTIKEEIAKFLGEAVEKASGEVLSPGDVASSFEAPREEKFGDLSTNAALKAAKAAKKVPRVVAEEITRHLGESIKRAGLEARISKIAVEGPGFINFT